MEYERIIGKVSEETGLPKNVVDKYYKAFWKYIKESISEIPFQKELSEEEFNKLRTNFNIPSIGKLNCTYDKYLNKKFILEASTKHKHNAEIKEDKTSV